MSKSNALVTTPCTGCGTPMEHYRSQVRKFCSRKCRYNVTQTYKDRQCDHCHGEYVPTHPRQRWCVTCVPSRDARARMQRYGVSEPEWVILLAKFRGKCWICLEKDADRVDHCHQTGTVRGALCSACNFGLHYLERSDWVTAASAYLNRR